MKRITRIETVEVSKGRPPLLFDTHVLGEAVTFKVPYNGCSDVYEGVMSCSKALEDVGIPYEFTVLNRPKDDISGKDTVILKERG